MAENIKEYDDEIDLLSLFQTIWDGKWKIASIIVVSLLSVFGYNIVIPNTSFVAQSEIKPITSYEFDKYTLFNASLKLIEKEEKKDKNNEEFIEKIIFEITPETLVETYIEQLEEGSLLETGIEKIELLNEDDYQNKDNYKEAIQKFASEIEILKPNNVDGKAKGEIRLYHVLNAEYNDVDKWKEFLSFVNTKANKQVKNILNARFENIVSVESQKKNFAIRDIQIQIDNVTKDYDRITRDRLAFLSEQASIARKLGVRKNTIESQMFDTQNTFVTNVKTDTPFYLRGYEAIEAEINIIKGRKNKSAFTNNLFKLEKDKRNLEQNEMIQRAIKLFEKTPLQQDDFKAVQFTVAATDFETNKKRNLFYALALVLGGMIGVFYVLINKALLNRKSISTQS
jgi:LPS O-antigen subunit length determinant protein (WzzB/FepE family)